MCDEAFEAVVTSLLTLALNLGGRQREVVAMDEAMEAILCGPLSNHQSLKPCAHVISQSYNLLKLQLKACFNGLHLSTSP